jgi:Uma2 family endonuclease
MSTITSTPPSVATSHPMPVPNAAKMLGEQRIAIRDIPWDLYDRLSEAIGEGQNVHLAYDGKDLEIMVLSREHEDFKDLFGRLVNTITDELYIANRGAGQTTWKRPEILRGLEADLCYYFDADKLAQDRAARKRGARDVANYPNPDFAVEIDLSPSQIDRPSIYRALGVAEVWRFDGEILVIEQMGSDGTYVRAESSRFLPIRVDEVVRWVVEENTDDLPAWRARLRAWTLAELAPRMKS